MLTTRRSGLPILTRHARAHRRMLVAGAAAALCAGLLTPAPAFADTTPTQALSTVQDAIDAFTGQTGPDLVTLTGNVTAGTGDRLTIPANTSITLNLAGFSLTITDPAAGRAAIHVPPTAALTIKDTTGNGAVIATGGAGESATGSAFGGGGGAGIGGDNTGASSSDRAGGTVTVSGGTVTATGGTGGGTAGSDWAGGGGAGIGGGGAPGLGGTGGTVTVSGGTVTATGGAGGTSSGSFCAGGGGAGIGGGGSSNLAGGAGGAVEVSGGTLTATGGTGGTSSSGGWAGGGGAGIGGGGNCYLAGGAGGTVTSSGGTVTATGGTGGTSTRSDRAGGGGAGIGGGGSSNLAGGAGGTVVNGGTILSDTTGTSAGPASANGKPSPVTGHNYTLSFDVNGGTDTAPDPLHLYAASIADAQQTLPPGPTPPADATFLGWYTQATGGSQVTASTDLTTLGTDVLNPDGPSSATLYAHYATAPDAPTDLDARPGYGQITLIWTAPDNDGGAAVTYSIYQGTAPGGENATPVNQTPITGTHQIITGLANGTTYYFTVTAVNAVGESTPSSEADAATAAVCPPAPFGDVDASNNFCTDIAWLKAARITSGAGDNLFQPTKAVSRQAMAAFLYRKSNPGHDAPGCPTPTPFPDVRSSSPFCGDIAWLKANHITQGTSDNLFRPTKAVSRQAMAAFLYRLTHQGQNATECPTPTPFPDVSASSPFCGDIAWLKANHITQGTSDNLFQPTKAVSRQAMAAFLHRLPHPIPSHA